LEKKNLGGELSKGSESRNRLHWIIIEFYEFGYGFKTFFQSFSLNEMGPRITT
jgi:hypothetical protein